jgi:anti-anti-sigma factor
MMRRPVTGGPNGRTDDVVEQRIDVRRVGTFAVVELVGAYDLSDGDLVARAVNGALDDATAAIVDLSSAEFIDSTILQGILLAHRNASNSGKGLAIVIPERPSMVRRVFEVTGLMRALPVYERVGDAIAAVGHVTGAARDA